MNNRTGGRVCTELAMPVLMAALIVLASCSDSGDQPMTEPVPALPQADNPAIEGPVTGGGAADCCIITFGGLVIDLREQGYVPGTPFYAGLSFDETEIGYRETEYFISGVAKSYTAAAELETDGVWNAEPAEGAEFTSRIVVLRPDNDADFNGTVVVEWFNVTGGLDAAPDWIHSHTALTREGYAWVGVSAQRVGIEGGGAFDLPLKTIDSERYASLNHPGDSFAYDIFSQAAQAVRNPVGLDPLAGLSVERMLATGQSQSASRLVTYVNAVHPTIDLFDGFLIHSRGGGSAALAQDPLVAIPAPAVVKIRSDLPEPIIMLQAETDVLGLNSLAARQDDSDKFRLWEVAGASHSDAYVTVKGPYDRGADPTVADVISDKSARPPFIDCALPVNDGPGHWLTKAAIGALDQWLRSGAAAATAPRLEINAEGTGYVTDEHGNTRGGIRTPYVDVPVATLSGSGQGAGFCRLFGTTALFDEPTLATLYPTKQAYVDAINESTDSAVAAGYLLPADGDLIKARALTSPIAQ